MEKLKYYGGTDGANTYYHFILSPFTKTGHNRTDLGGWEFREDRMTGCFSIEKGDVLIYATPFWEVDGLPIYATTIDHGEEIGCVDLELTPTGDSKTDVKEYFDKLATFVAVHNL
jgi:hypothetical protein